MREMLIRKYTSVRVTRIDLVLVKIGPDGEPDWSEAPRPVSTEWDLSEQTDADIEDIEVMGPLESPDEPDGLTQPVKVG